MKDPTIITGNVNSRWMNVFQAAVVIRYGSNPHQVESWLPTDRVTLWADVGITVDRLILLAIGSASAFGLWLLYRSTQFGLATEAVAESERSAEAIGLSPNRIALLNWALGSGLAAVAGMEPPGRSTGLCGITL